MQLILIIHAVLAVAAVALLVRGAVVRRRLDVEAARQVARLREEDLLPTLHPVIDPARCMGSGACVQACPEHGPLVLSGGRGHLAAPAACIGHGRCAAACPVGAITLVFGTAQRGVDLPALSGDFETSQPGLYIAGELGGMGLVANAVQQGVEALEAIAKSLAAEGAGPPGALPLVIAGSGPAGLGAALAARQLGIEARTLEREAGFGGSVRGYPRSKIVMTRPVDLPGYGKVRLRRTTRESLIELWEDVLARSGIAIDFGVELRAVRREGPVLVVDTSRGALRARRVLLATGRRGRPRPLDVPGEDRPHVHRALEDAALHDGMPCVVFGGGDSAVEAALDLASRPGARVVLCHRGARFDRIKPDNLQRLGEAEAQGRLGVRRSATLRSIDPDAVHVTRGDGVAETLPARAVFALIGRELPVGLLRSCGIELRTYHGEQAPVRAAG